MKKLLGILVLGLLWCNVGFAATATVDCDWNDEACNWRAYKAIDKKYTRVWGIILSGREKGDFHFMAGATSLQNTLNRFHNFAECKNVVCKVTHVGVREINNDEQRKIAKQYYPPGTISKYFAKKKKSEDDVIGTGEDSSVEDFAKKSEKKTTEEPKKKGSKPSPDADDKVVAAASGTGFFVSRTGHVITNHHVIEECKIVKVSFKGDQVEAKILAIDKMNDLAIVKTNLTPTRVYSVSNEDAPLLEDIIIAGYPLGKQVSSAIKTSKGSVTALAGYGDNFSEFQTDAALNQGNSGGPIMNQKGNVVGVAVAAFGKKEGVESFNFGIKASTLKTFANSNGLKFSPPNNRDLSNKDLGQLINNATVYIECHMTIAKVKAMIAKTNNRKAFFSEYQ